MKHSRLFPARRVSSSSRKAREDSWCQATDSTESRTRWKVRATTPPAGWFDRGTAVEWTQARFWPMSLIGIEAARLFRRCLLPSGGTGIAGRATSDCAVLTFERGPWLLRSTWKLRGNSDMRCTRLSLWNNGIRLPPMTSLIRPLDGQCLVVSLVAQLLEWKLSRFICFKGMPAEEQDGGMWIIPSDLV